MAGPSRNSRCPCSSGAKVKRCCGQRTGPSDESLARAWLARVAEEEAGLALATALDEGPYGATDEIGYLPERHDTLLLPLPRPLPPELKQVRRSLLNEEPEPPAALDAAVRRCATQVARRRLGEALLDLRARGVERPGLVAVALLDLTQPDSRLARGSLIQSVAVQAGVVRAASGLTVVPSRVPAPDLSAAAGLVRV